MSNAGAGFVQGVKKGNQITPKGSNNSGSTVDEFSSHESIQNADLEPEDLVVEELAGDGRTRIRELDSDSDEHYVKIEDPHSEYAQLWFDDDEIEELSQKHELVTGEPTEPPSIDEVWDGIKEDCRERNKQVAKLKMAEEIESAREEMEEYTKYSTPVQELEGGDFLEILQESQGNGNPEPEGFAEVKEKIRQKYSPIINGGDEPEIKNSTEELEEGIRAFREYDNPVFEELADDLEKSSSETMYESVDENTKRVTTSEPEMKEALRNHENEPFDGSVEIEQDTDSKVVAVVSK